MEKEQEPFTVLLEKIYVRKEEEIKKRQLGTRAILFFSAVIPVFVFCYLEKLSPYIVVVWLVAMQVIVIHGIPNSFVAKIRKKLRI